MKIKGARKQTAFLTLINGAVRALGLLLRVVLSRYLGAEIMGIAELAQSVHMLAITPLTSGLPMAVSRLTAKSRERDRQKPLLAGLSLVRYSSAIIIPLILLFSPLLARLMGDARVMPSLWFTAPCVLVLGFSAAYNGYCYGREMSVYPALSELIEQVVRLAAAYLLLRALSGLTSAWAAAIPVAATLFAEILGLVYMVFALKLPAVSGVEYRSWRKPVLRLAVPTTLSRLVQTLLRSLTAILIPIQLQKSGLVPAEATARLGMLNGMAMPILMLPCVFTSALTMVALPRLAKAEDSPKELRRLLLLCMGTSLPIGLICSTGVYLLAPFLANSLYRTAELSVIFRQSAPLAALFSISHVMNGISAALGQQKRSMYGAIPISTLTLILTYVLTANPNMRLYGVIAAQTVCQIISMLWQLGVLLMWRKERHSREMARQAL